MTPEEFVAGRPLAVAALARVRAILDAGPVYEIRVTTSQIAFRRARGFAFLWLPGRYLSHPKADVVLTIALGRPDPSPRFTEVVHPSATQWIHHLRLAAIGDLDDEVAAWLAEAADRAG